MHDHGSLPVLREGGHGAVLIGCVKMAKKFNDDYISRIIETRKAAGIDRIEAQPTKKAKTSAKGRK
jgi:hypothetical protein